VRLGQKSARAQQHLAYRYYAEGNIMQSIFRLAARRQDAGGAVACPIAATVS
jgi:hypothetical protein